MYSNCVRTKLQIDTNVLSVIRNFFVFSLETRSATKSLVIQFGLIVRGTHGMLTISTCVLCVTPGHGPFSMNLCWKNWLSTWYVVIGSRTNLFFLITKQNKKIYFLQDYDGRWNRISLTRRRKGGTKIGKNYETNRQHSVWFKWEKSHNNHWCVWCTMHIATNSQLIFNFSPPWLTEGATTIYLKILNHKPDPQAVLDHLVPLLCEQYENTPIDVWDLTTQQVLPYINGINHVARIAAESDVEKALVKACIQNLVYHEVVQLLPLLKYSNVYMCTRNLQNLTKDRVMGQSCR